jgi:hypothetical protein
VTMDTKQPIAGGIFFNVKGAADDDENCTEVKLPGYFWEVTIGNSIGDYQSGGSDW